MILADKLFTLRNSSGLSQEELAEKMNVSRQSISKWESGNSIPSMDKIVQLSNIYGVSTDYLLKDDMETLPDEIVVDFDDEQMEKELTLNDVRDYLSRVERVRTKNAFAIFACIICAAPLLIFLGLSTSPSHLLSENAATAIGISILLVFVASAVTLFIMNDAVTKKYEFLEKDSFVLSYGVKGILQKEQENYLPTHHKLIAIGVVLCVLSAVPLLVTSLLVNDQQEYLLLYSVAILLVLVGCGVFLIIRSSSLYSAYDKLLQKGDYTKRKKKAGKRLSLFSGIYWTLMTAAYLLISFLTMKWDMTWMIWPVAGVVYAAVYAILEAKEMKQSEY